MLTCPENGFSSFETHSCGFKKTDASSSCWTNPVVFTIVPRSTWLKKSLEKCKERCPFATGHDSAFLVISVAARFQAKRRLVPGMGWSDCDTGVGDAAQLYVNEWAVIEDEDGWDKKWLGCQRSLVRLRLAVHCTGCGFQWTAAAEGYHSGQVGDKFL